MWNVDAMTKIGKDFFRYFFLFVERGNVYNNKEKFRLWEKSRKLSKWIEDLNGRQEREESRMLAVSTLLRYFWLLSHDMKPTMTWPFTEQHDE